MTGTFSGDLNHSDLQTNVAGPIFPARTLCPTSTLGCGVPGLYHVHWSLIQTDTACTTPGSGGVTFLLSWTDRSHIAHSSQPLPMFDGSSLTVPGGVFHFRDATGASAAWASGDFNVYTDGASAIKYETGYTACQSGSGHYDLAATVTQLQ